MATLQEQVNIASAGATIQHDTEFVGSLTISKPVTIQGTGIIRSGDAQPAIYIPPKTGPVVLKGKSVNEPLRVTHTTQIYDIIRWGDWRTSLLADVPQGLSLEYVDVFGADGQESQRGIAVNGANFSIRNSKVRSIKGRGYDTQAICGWNGPGPFKILDCFLEASGENVLFGGALASINGLVPSNIEIRRVHFFKPLEWRGMWSVKNLLEFKSARNVIVDGCTFENCWVDGQIGYAILLTVRGEDGKMPWATLEDISITNFVIKNVAGGFQLLGKDYAGASGQAERLRIANGVVNISTAMGTNGRMLLLQGYNQVTVENVESEPPHSFLILTGSNPDGTPMLNKGLVYRNNLFGSGEYGMFADGAKPMAYFAPDGQFIGNVVYPKSLPLPGNTYLTTKPTTVPSGVGVDYAALKAAQTGMTTAPAPTPSPTPQPLPTTPAPSPNGTKAVKITDSSGRVWTLGSRGETLRDQIHIASGFGSIYKWQDSIVYVFGEDGNWWKFNGEGWEKFGATEPGVSVPQPAPVPAPTPVPPAPQPPISNTRTSKWPKEIRQQNLRLEAQRADRFYLKQIDERTGMATFERVG